jgi:serralysin
MQRNAILKTIFYAVAALAALSVAPVRGSIYRYNMYSTIVDIVIEQSGGTDAWDHNENDYDILIKAVLTADLADALSDKTAKLTVFAPTDGAFFALAKDLGYKNKYDEEYIFDFLVEALGTLGDAVEVLTNILLYHVVDGVLTTGAIRNLARKHKSISTLLEDAKIYPKESYQTIYLRDEDPDLADPSIIHPRNIKAQNGIIHTINRVLTPLDI